jgi:hypothetical protein
MGQVAWFLFGLGLGLALDWVLVKLMLKPLKVRLKVLEQESAQSKGSQQDYPRAQGWKSYQNSLQEQESDLARESDRQQAEKQQWKQW